MMRARNAITPWKPTPAQVVAAARKTLPDLIRPNLGVLFCGINPGLYSAAIGRHFGRPGNRFWTTIYRAGFTPRLLSPFEQHALLDLGCGVTNIAARATAAADELTRDELLGGAKKLLAKVRKYQPRWLAVLGVGAYRIGFAQPRAIVGPQEQRIGGSGIWVLPNPSGLNAHYQADALVREFTKLRKEICEA